MAIQRYKDIFENVIFLSENAVLDDAVNSPKSVFPTYFFAILVCPAVIRDADFVDSDTGYFGYFGSYFRLKSKPIFFQRDGLDYLGIKKFVASFHVGQIQIIEGIGELRQKLIAYRMPKEEDTVRFSTHKSGAVNHIGVAVNDRF